LRGAVGRKEFFIIDDDRIYTPAILAINFQNFIIISMYRMMFFILVSVLLGCTSSEQEYLVDDATYTSEMYIGDWISTGRYTKNSVQLNFPDDTIYLLSITPESVHFRDSSNPEFAFETPWEVNPIPVISEYGISESISSELRGIYCPVFPNHSSPPFLFLAWYNDYGDYLEMEFVRK
jgi:hypothetical protein